MQETSVCRRADKLIADFVASAAEKTVTTSAFNKAKKDLTHNEHFAIASRCDPDAAFVNKARTKEQVTRMDTVHRLEKAMNASKQNGGDPNKIKTEICRIYGIDPEKVNLYNVSEADDIRLVALVEALELIREKVSRLDLDDLLDGLIQIVKHRKK